MKRRAPTAEELRAIDDYNAIAERINAKNSRIFGWRNWKISKPPVDGTVRTVGPTRSISQIVNDWNSLWHR